MNEVLFNKIQRLKEEVKYLIDHKNNFLQTLRSSLETKKIVERSVISVLKLSLILLIFF